MFSNPYQSHPDYGQGFSDLAAQLMQFLLMKKYMGQGQGKTQQATATLPQQTGTAQMGAQGMTPPAAGNMGGYTDYGAQAQNRMTPQMLQQLAAALGIDLSQLLGR